MNGFVLYLASGDSFFLGAAVVILVLAVSPFLKLSWLQRLRNITFLLAVASMIVASPTFAWATDAVFLAFSVLWFVSWNRGQSPILLRTAVSLVLFVMTAILSTIEFSRRQMPQITGSPSDHLVVIGDSLSAGLGRAARAWPTFLEQATGIPVKSLAVPGATAADAETMAAEVATEDRILLIEIGGNDLFSGVSCSTFGQRLKSLLSRLATPGRTLVMFELPILPTQIACGRYQRQLAKTYGVFLIPKHYLIDVIGSPNATIDGLHLTEVGARRFAALVQKALSPLLRKGFATASQSFPAF
jgi:acyl-CoA thioesterase-1